MITLKKLMDSIRKRFATTDAFGSASNLADVHIGFLVNEQKGIGLNIFTPTRRFGDQSEDKKSSNFCFCFCCFTWIYHTIRDLVAGIMISDLDYRHCELAFDQEMFSPEDLKPVLGIPYTQSCYVSYGTNLNEKVLMRKPRTFEPRRDKKSLEKSGIRNPDKAYQWIHLRLPYDDVRTLIDFCEAERGKKYDVRALERMPLFPKKLKPVGDWRKQKWHCTNFTVCMLQQIGLLVGLDPNAMTADDVYLYLKGHRCEKKTVITPARMIKEYCSVYTKGNAKQRE
jgi:hypothetical protein